VCVVWVAGMTDHLLDDEREALRLAGAANGIVPRLIGRLVEARAALAGERERCAAVCEAMAGNVNPPYTPYAALDMAAARIRSGGAA
jgi:hypothetical protein